MEGQIIISAIKNSDIELKNEPILKLIMRNDRDHNEENQIRSYFKEKTRDINSFLNYYNREQICYLLDKYDLIIRSSKCPNDFSQLSLLSLMIEYNKYDINYVFDILFIKNIFSKFSEELNNNKHPIKLLIIIKCIQILINNFVYSEEYDLKKHQNRIKYFKNKLRDIIIRSIREFERINLKNITFDFLDEMSLEDIYELIILETIKRRNFFESEEDEQIFEQINLNLIPLSGKIFGHIKPFFIEKNSLFQRFEINDLASIKEKKNIRFTYICIKYIFKSPIFVYQINLLTKNLANIKKLVLQNLSSVKGESSINENEIKFLLTFISDYYIQLFEGKGNKEPTGGNKPNNNPDNNDNQNNDPDNDNITSKYNKIGGNSRNSLNCPTQIPKSNNTSKQQNEKKTISQDKNSYDTDTNENSEKPNKQKLKKLKKLTKSIREFIQDEFIQKFIPKLIILIEILYDKSKNEKNVDFYFYGEGKNPIEKDKIELIHNYEEYEGINDIDKNFTKFCDFIKEIADYLKNSEIKFNPIIKLEFKIEEYYDSNRNSELKNITCYYTFINQFKSKNGEKEYMNYKDIDILCYGIDGKSQGFIFLVEELSNLDYINKKYDYKKDFKIYTFNINSRITYPNLQIV